MIVVIDILVKESNEEFVLKELQKIVLPTIQEIGCIQYDVHIDCNNQTQLLIYEQWKTKEDYENHTHNIHVVQCLKNIKDVIIKYELKEMCLIK